MDAEFANIYAGPEQPYNTCCRKYLQISDGMMFKSILKNKKVGRSFETDCSDYKAESSVTLKSKHKSMFSFLSRYFGSFFRLMREMLWIIGKYDKNAIKTFIDEFNPDVIFSERMASCKMLRLEKIVSEMTDAPFLLLPVMMNIL